MNKILRKNFKIVIIGKKDVFFEKIIIFLRKKKIRFIYRYLEKDSKKKELFNFLKTKNFDYLLSYRNPLILDNKMLGLAKKLNVNFHPSPPRYRGVGGFNLAILNSDKEFGATAHLMTSKVDGGLIIDMKSFKISKKINLDELILKTRKLQYLQVKKLLNQIIDNNLNLELIKNRNKKKSYKWSKKIFYLKDLEKLYKIDYKKIKKINIDKYLRSTLTENFRPEILVGNNSFVLKNE